MPTSEAPPTTRRQRTAVRTWPHCSAASPSWKPKIGASRRFCTYARSLLGHRTEPSHAPGRRCEAFVATGQRADIGRETTTAFTHAMASIYAQIGGHEALESVVADFYDRVLADDEPGTSGPRDHHSPLHSCRRASRVCPAFPTALPNRSSRRSPRFVTCLRPAARYSPLNCQVRV